ncbi:glycosyltransferase family 2 protein [Vibrio parahaemolyticus]|uniref:glycosyltransferase family 2 protein n=1 Tax=Vibrio parahaemolyticus TaxID=670 RepID=UPI001D507536|nr:glycosyltransferase family 2 protein [Vibrio parahaemolyticus]EJG0712545.1 glycosyltransferase family 2 protein [Vibrio parahaemolyticus]EJG1184740.1 glycosyltransferase family 2 protein [Vibrio parahaemolyticus]MDF5375389.1 glycosyltransferase family 2 protein [Vibrio parahaemolyticus]MEA5328534.1 glycosyltransferase family 2 protein [Vibrio parahaemolyticus]HCE4655961.1 glycosyltransferase family 2 protein [Vibrio parahaemolyticus]
MEHQSKLVSIIMPTYNSTDTVVESIQSVLSQTYKNWELIIVDDRSIDNTWQVIQTYADKYDNIRVYQNKENLGAGASRNFAIKKARGRFIAFLDSDDLWTEDKLAEQIPFMLKNNYPLTYTHYSRFNSEEELSVVTAPEYTTYKKLMYSNVIGCLTAVYDTQALGKRYMPLIRKRQDMGLWLDILKDTPKAYCLPKPLAKYRMDSGMTANKFSVLSYQWKFYRDVVGLSLPRSLFTFSVYAVKGTMKHRTKRKS